MLAVALGIALAVGAAGCGGPAPRPSSSTPSPTSTSPPAPPVVRVASADYIGVVTMPAGAYLGAYQKAETPPRDRAYVVGPRYYAGLDGVAVTREFTVSQSPGASFASIRATSALGPMPSGWTASTVLQAADGHEFVVAHLVAKPGDTVNGDTGVGIGLVDASVRLGSAAAVSLGNVENNAIIVVSVPPGGDPLLVLDQKGGHPQSLHLRTGERADAEPLFYPVRKQDIKAEPAVALMSGQAFYLKESVSLVPWDAGRGWARPGRGWLLMAVRVMAVESFAMRLDAARSFSLTLTDRTVIRSRPEIVNVNVARADAELPAFSVVFDVPAGFRSGSIRCTLAGSIATTGSGPFAPISVAGTQDEIGGVSLPA
ncbi:MAG TPA: hypothetical protein VEK80_10480 [Kribbellaceae bacterium]|nr:hypothetical protein [Kribbellaceae bacterium]